MQKKIITFMSENGSVWAGVCAPLYEVIII